MAEFPRREVRGAVAVACRWLYVAAAASGGGGGGSDGGGSGISDGMAGRARTWRTQRVYRHRRPDAFLLSFIKVTCEPFLNLKI